MEQINFNDRREYIGLSTEKDRLPENLENGSTFYAVDTKKIYIFYNAVWYEM